jgi:PAS domain S-box-containing protein
MIEPLVSQKLSELKDTIDLYRTNRVSEALAIVNSDRGRAYMDQIRSICAQIEEIAAARLDHFQSEAEKAASNLRRGSLGGSLVLVAFLVLSTIAIFRGMTRREELFRRVYASEKLISTTLTSIADGVIATDEQARITFINPVAQQLTGCSESEAIGAQIHRVFVIVNETTRLKTSNPLEEALQQGKAVRLANHTSLIPKTGEEIPIDDSAAPPKDERGKLIGAVLVFRDISAGRKVERQLRNANEELQQFVDAAAHDLSSPLNTVNVMAELLANQFQHELGPKGDELVGHISGAIARMKRLLDDLLAFARASHFEKESAVPISLDAPLQLALQNLKGEIQSNGATIDWGSLPFVALDEAHAVQLFQNLIGNAIKYRTGESVRVQIRAERKDGECLIAVTDNGIGIEREHLDKIFKPFKRLHGAAYPGLRDRTSHLPKDR